MVAMVKVFFLNFDFGNFPSPQNRESVTKYSFFSKHFSQNDTKITTKKTTGTAWLL
jgi:hypothetical protein